MSANDLFHIWSTDLNATITGDLMPVDGAEFGRQRILRRLLTSPNEYYAHPEYGAGLPSYVGSVANDKEIYALIKQHMRLEGAVDFKVEPEISLKRFQGGIEVNIKYLDAKTQSLTTLNFKAS